MKPDTIDILQNVPSVTGDVVRYSAYGNSTVSVPSSRASPKMMAKPISTVFNKLPGLRED